MEQSESVNPSFLRRMTTFFGVRNIAELCVVLSLPPAILLTGYAVWDHWPPRPSPLLSPVDLAFAAFEKAEGDFHTRLAALQGSDIDPNGVNRAEKAASADIFNCAVWLRKLRALDPKNESKWSALEKIIADDQDLLAQLPVQPGETVGVLETEYSKTLHDFNVELDAGERLLEDKPSNGGSPDFTHIDEHFTAAQKALVNLQTVLGRLRRVAPSRADAWNADQHEIDSETRQLTADWNLFETHEGNEAAAPYED
jgi:hypothetical protein